MTTDATFLVIVIDIVIARDIAREFRSLLLQHEFGDHFFLNLFAASLIDRMRDIGIQFSAAVIVFDDPIGRQFVATLIAE